MSIIERPEIFEETALESTERCISQDPEIIRRREIDELFPASYIAELTSNILDRYSVGNKLGDRRWAVLALDGEDPLADIPRYIECETFTKLFDLSPHDMRTQYGKYDSNSIFITVIDCAEDNPKPASMIRITRNASEGIKTLNTMTNTNPGLNPWYEELSKELGVPLELTSPQVVKDYFALMLGDDINLDETWGIESMAALDGYSGHKGQLDHATFPLYAACLQLSDILGQRTWVSGQDVKPYQQMQDLFSEPWQIIGDLPAKVFEGTPVLPTVIPDLALAEEKLANEQPEVAEMMIKLGGLSMLYAMPDELQGINELRGLDNLDLRVVSDVSDVQSPASADIAA